MVGYYMATETPKYKLIKKEGSFEIRSYDEMIVARTSVDSNYKESTFTGFRRIASYIFGDNVKEMKISMTAPVISDCPSGNENPYEILFVMPKKHSLEDLPKANTELISIEKKNLGEVATVVFGGWATETRCLVYQKKLLAFMNKRDLKQKGGFMIAQYNSPWVLPPFRKNEVMVEILNSP